MDMFAIITDEDIAFRTGKGQRQYKKGYFVSVALFQTYLQEKNYARI